MEKGVSRDSKAYKDAMEQVLRDVRGGDERIQSRGPIEVPELDSEEEAEAEGIIETEGISVEKKKDPIPPKLNKEVKKKDPIPPKLNKEVKKKESAPIPKEVKTETPKPVSFPEKKTQQEPRRRRKKQTTPTSPTVDQSPTPKGPYDHLYKHLYKGLLPEGSASPHKQTSPSAGETNAKFLSEKYHRSVQTVHNERRKREKAELVASQLRKEVDDLRKKYERIRVAQSREEDIRLKIVTRIKKEEEGNRIRILGEHADAEEKLLYSCRLLGERLEESEDLISSANQRLSASESERGRLEKLVNEMSEEVRTSKTTSSNLRNQVVQLREDIQEKQNAYSELLQSTSQRVVVSDASKTRLKAELRGLLKRSEIQLNGAVGVMQGKLSASDSAIICPYLNGLHRMLTDMMKVVDVLSEEESVEDYVLTSKGKVDISVQTDSLLEEEDDLEEEDFEEEEAERLIDDDEEEGDDYEMIDDYDSSIPDNYVEEEDEDEREEDEDEREEYEDEREEDEDEREEGDGLVVDDGVVEEEEDDYGGNDYDSSIPDNYVEEDDDDYGGNDYVNTLQQVEDGCVVGDFEDEEEVDDIDDIGDIVDDFERDENPEV